MHVLMFLALCGAVIWIWPYTVRPIGFVGQVEALDMNVASRDDGVITNLWVTPLQDVRGGDLIAEVITTDPRTVNNRLEVMRDRMRLTQLEMDPILNRQRGALTYEQLSVDCAKERVALAVAMVNMDRAKLQWKRDEQLFKDGILSQELLELSAATAKALEAEVAERKQLVERTAKALERLAFMADAFLPGGENDPLKQALAVEEDKVRIFEAKAAPLRLLSPTNGVVTAIHHHPGEQIRAGDPIVTITMKRSERIVGYLDSDYTIQAQVGMEVEVSTRDFRPRRAMAVVTGVSPQLQAVTNAVVQPIAIRHGTMTPVVRLITVSLPEGLELAPGQPVDLRLRDMSRY
jgi:multidrug resistance efflux pump